MFQFIDRIDAPLSKSGGWILFASPPSPSFGTAGAVTPVTVLSGSPQLPYDTDHSTRFVAGQPKNRHLAAFQSTG
jgi:hypothetical protein